MSAEEAIRRAIEAFCRAYRDGDLDALLACYSDDLIKDRAGAPAERKAQTAARVARVFAECDTDIDVEVDEIASSGDLAYVRGSFVVALKPRSGAPPAKVTRRYLEIWRNEAGNWRVTRTLDNEP